MNGHASRTVSQNSRRVRVTERPLEFHAPLPADMAAALPAWGLRYNPPNGS